MSELEKEIDKLAQKYLNTMKHVTANRHIIFSSFKHGFEAGFNYDKNKDKTDEELLQEAIDRTEKEFFP